MKTEGVDRAEACPMHGSECQDESVGTGRHMQPVRAWQSWRHEHYKPSALCEAQHALDKLKQTADGTLPPVTVGLGKERVGRAVMKPPAYRRPKFRRPDPGPNTVAFRAQGVGHTTLCGIYGGGTWTQTRRPDSSSSSKNYGMQDMPRHAGSRMMGLALSCPSCRTASKLSANWSKDCLRLWEAGAAEISCHASPPSSRANGRCRMSPGMAPGIP